MRHKLGVVIVTYNSEKYIDQCLNSIKKEQNLNANIVVVDNNSSDNTVNLLKSHNDVSLIKNKENVGYAKGVSNYVDTGLNTHNIDLNDFANKDPINIAKELSLKNKNDYFEEEYLCGDCFLTNRKLLEKIGYFDCSNFKDYLGDLDFGLRAKAFDFKCIVSRAAFYYHHAGINFDYLSEEQKKNKLRRRSIFLMEDWARFKMKYNLPITLIYPGVNKIDFNEITNKVNKKIEIKKKDYSKYLV